MVLPFLLDVYASSREPNARDIQSSRIESLTAEHGDWRLTLRAKIDRIIVVSTANGLKFADLKVAYHTGSLANVTPRWANPPIELPDDYDAVRRALDRATAGTT